MDFWHQPNSWWRLMAYKKNSFNTLTPYVPSMSVQLVSIVVPVYNSYQSLPELYAGIEKTMAETSLAFEVVFVDDHSSDASWASLQALKQQHHTTIRLVRLARNFGQHNATLCGLSKAKGDIVITIDDDLQTPPAEIKKLLDQFASKPSDVIYGISPRKNGHSFIRKSGSKTLKQVSKSFRGTPGEGSSFRLITKNIADKLLNHQFHFVFIDELLLWYTNDIDFVEVQHVERKYSQSGYSFRKLFHLITNLVIFYTDAPLKVMVYGGFLASFISFIMGLVYIIKKMFYNVPLGYTSLIVAILFSTSIILLSLGILGEYISRLYKVQNRKPPFSIQKTID
jgi:undecaprenyl-phosphate 4-deoxy-4-formamido-L-arabinose transferase